MAKMQLSKPKRRQKDNKRAIRGELMLAEEEKADFEEDREKVDLEEKQLLHLGKQLHLPKGKAGEGCSKRCGGHCCRRFRFGRDSSMKQIWEEYDRALKSGNPTRDDIHIVAPMLIPLGRSNVNGNGKVDGEAAYWYSCKHLDTETGLCTIYEHRPRVCRIHGDVDGGFAACQYDACGAKQPGELPLGA